MRNLIFILALLLIYSCSIQNEDKDEADILTILNTQQKAWSENDLEAFMEGYWKSDSLKFYGASGMTYGWENTLANYKKRYPTKDHSGVLDFKINDISKIDKDSYFVMGEFFLTRPVGDANGIFMIIFRRINGEWKIIADTSC